MSNKINELIGKRVAKIRKERELKQAELAELIDVTIETVSRLECGTTIPSLKTLENISNALKIPLKDIFDFEQPMIKENFESEKETIKLLAFLKTKSPKDIKMSYQILRKIFEQIDKNYNLK